MLSGILISKLDITPEHYDLRHLNWDFYYGLECVSHKCICRKKTDYMFLIFVILQVVLTCFVHISHGYHRQERK